MIRIVVAHDHAIIRRGLCLLLEEQQDFQVIGEAGDGRRALTLVESLCPDVAVLEISLPYLNGIEAARQMSAKQSSLGIVMLSMNGDESSVLRALRAGARGYLLKESPETDFIQAIRRVSEGKTFFSRSIGRMLAQSPMRQLQARDIDDSYELLTAREREILQLVAEGKSNKEAASILNLSPHTVETHRSNIMEKLNLHTAPELTLYAVRKGVVA